MTDVVDELLGHAPPQQARIVPPPVGSDVVDELLTGGSQSRRISAPGSSAETETAIQRQQAGGVRLKDLPLANYDAGSDKWSDQGTVPFSVLTKAGVVDDPQTKLKIYAHALKIPVERMGMVEGEPIYLARDGKLYRATPGGFLGGAKSMVADTAAHAPAIAAGAVGGAMAGNIPGAVAGAALGGGAGEAVRKIGGNLIFGEPQTPGGVASSITKEGLISAGGVLMGAGLASWMQRNVAKDVSRLDPAAAASLQGKARTAGVDLTPAEITNLPSLKGQQKAVGNLPQSADVVDQFMQKRPAQVQSAAGKFFDTISPEDSVELAGRRTKEAAADSVERIVGERKAAASPVYKRAFDEFEGIPKDELKAIKALRERLPRGVEQYAIELARQEGINLKEPGNSLLGMHYIKVATDARRQALLEKGAFNEARIVGQNLKGLVTMMDRVSPKDEQGRSLYKLARNIYEASSPQVERAKEGLLGGLAGTPEAAEINVPRKLFDAANNGPIAVSRVMQDLRKTDPDAADQALRAFLQDKFEESGRQFASRTAQATQGARFRAAMVGNKRQQEVLRAAMTPQQWRGFNDLMEVFEATGRSPMSGSDTAWNLEARKLLESQSGSKLADAAGLFSPQDLGSKVREALKSKAVDRYAQKVAEVITSPDGMRRIKELKQMPIGSQKRLLGVSAALGLIGSNPIQSGLLPGSEVPLGSTTQPQEARQ